MLSIVYSGKTILLSLWTPHGISYREAWSDRQKFKRQSNSGQTGKRVGSTYTASVFRLLWRLRKRKRCTKRLHGILENLHWQKHKPWALHDGDIIEHDTEAISCYIAVMILNMARTADRWIVTDQPRLLSAA